MHSHLHTRIIAVAVVGLIALTAWAAPIMRKSGGLADTDRSLAGLKRIELIVEPLPAPIKDVGFNAEMLRKVIAKDLEAAGYKIIDTEKAPKLGVLVSAVIDPNVPDGIAYSVNMVLNQRVMIERLDQRLFVPTHAQVVLGLETKQNLRNSVKKTVKAMTQKWIDLARIVTDSRP